MSFISHNFSQKMLTLNRMKQTYVPWIQASFVIEHWQSCYPSLNRDSTFGQRYIRNSCWWLALGELPELLRFRVSQTPAQLDWVRQCLIRIHESARPNAVESGDPIALLALLLFHSYKGLQFDLRYFSVREGNIFERRFSSAWTPDVQFAEGTIPFQLTPTCEACKI